MKKVTLFLAVLILTTSLTSCYHDDYFEPAIAAALLGPPVFILALSGKVTQQIPDSNQPEIYQFNTDFNVEMQEGSLTIESTFAEGGHFTLEAKQSEEGSNWIITDTHIQDVKKMQTRFDIDPDAPKNITILEHNPLTNEIDLNFSIVLQDLIDQVSIPMTVTFEGSCN